MVQDERDALVVGKLGKGILDPGTALLRVDALKERLRRRELDRGQILAPGAGPAPELREETPAVAVALQVVDREVCRHCLEPAARGRAAGKHFEALVGL